MSDYIFQRFLSDISSCIASLYIFGALLSYSVIVLVFLRVTGCQLNILRAFSTLYLLNACGLNL